SPVFDLAGVETNATVSLLRGGTAVTSRTGNGAVTDTSAPEGNQTYTASQVDVAGNTSAASSGLAVTVDRTVAAPGAPDLQAGSDSGISTSDNITTALAHAFDLSGIETGATATLLRGGTAVGTRTGNGAVTDSATLADGNFVYTATQVDVAGNTSPASTG